MRLVVLAVAGPPAPQAALIGLAGVLVAGIGGLVLLERAAASTDALARRSEMASDDRASDRLLPRLDRRLRRTGYGRWLSLHLVAAGVNTRVVDATAIAAAAALGGFVVGRAILPEWVAVLVAALAVRLCWAWVERRRRKRTEDFVGQLPELARVLSNATSAGLAVTTAVDMAATELTDPARSEMVLTAEELRIGQSLESALTSLERRMPSREVGVLVGTLVVQQRSGGRLVQALRDLAETLEARKELRREIRTVMSGAVFTGYLVAGMGAGTVVILNVVDPGILRTMTSSLIGQAAFVISMTLYALGFLMVRRVTRIET